MSDFMEPSNQGSDVQIKYRYHTNKKVYTKAVGKTSKFNLPHILNLKTNSPLDERKCPSYRGLINFSYNCITLKFHFIQIRKNMITVGGSLDKITIKSLISLFNLEFMEYTFIIS